MISEPKLRDAVNRLNDIRVKRAVAKREVEKAQVTFANIEQRLTDAHVAAALGEGTTYEAVRADAEKARGAVWEAERKAHALTLAEAEQEKRVAAARVDAEMEVGRAVRELLHAPAVARQLAAMQTLHNADRDEELIRDALADACSQYAKDSTVARARACRYIRPMSSGLSKGRTERFRSEASQHGGYDV